MSTLALCLAASVSGRFKHEGTTWHVITDAAGGTLDVPVWIRLFIMETVSVRVALKQKFRVLELYFEGANNTKTQCYILFVDTTIIEYFHSQM